MLKQLTDYFQLIIKKTTQGHGRDPQGKVWGRGGELSCPLQVPHLLSIPCVHQWDEITGIWGLTQNPAISPPRRSGKWGLKLSRKWQPIPLFLSEESHGQRSQWAKVHEVAKRRALNDFAQHDHALVFLENSPHSEAI